MYTMKGTLNGKEIIVIILYKVQYNNDECQLKEKITNIKKRNKGVNIASRRFLQERITFIIEHKLIF